MIRTGALVVAVLAYTVPALAHHGGGTFELGKSVHFEGKLTRIELINPHSWLYFETTGPDGKIMKHRCEMRSAHTLRRSGWEPSLFPVGSKIIVDASPDRADPASCYLNTIKFENGNVMDRYGQYVKAGSKVTEVRGAVKTVDTSKREAKLKNGEPNITGDWAPEQVVMRDPRGTGGGLVPLSQIGERPQPGERQGGGRAAAGGAQPAAGGAPAARGNAPAAGATAPAAGAAAPAAGAAAPAAGAAAPAAGGGARPGGAGRGGGRGGVQLTEAGTAAAAKNKQANYNPRMQCETTSIIFDWTFDGPVNRITQNKDNIVIQYGQMNLKRTVYMNMKEHPATIKPTRAGHSIGRWDGETLVVDTVGFLPGVLTGNTPNSDKLHVVERFTLDPKTVKLTRAYTADDSAFFVGQVTGQDIVAVADQPYTEDKCKDQTTLDYSKANASTKK